VGRLLSYHLEEELNRRTCAFTTAGWVCRLAQARWLPQATGQGLASTLGLKIDSPSVREVQCGCFVRLYGRPDARRAAMQEKIGTAAGLIWEALNRKGELSLGQLKREVKGKTPIFDWAIGWLAREEKILVKPEKRSFRFRLREPNVKSEGVS